MGSPVPMPFVPDEVERIRPGITCEWFSNRQIVAYKITAMSPTIINDWAALALKNLEAWPDDRPYLALHDLSEPGVSLQYATLVGFDTINMGIIPANRPHVDAIIKTKSGLIARVAMSFSLSLSGQINKVLADGKFNTDQSYVIYRAFYNRNKSLSWLTEAIPAQNA